jgi:phosphohistidine swiveling domain-containing protein
LNSELDPEASNVLHSLSRRACWSRANEKGVFPGVSTVLNWSIWGEIGERGTRRAAFELGLFTADELEPPSSADDWMWSIFYGRPSANVDCWRDLYERGLTESGAGGEAQRQVFGSASAEADTVPAPDRRAEVSAKRPAALANATRGLRSVRKEIGEWWKRATNQAALSDRSQSEDYFSQAVAWFERADPYHIMVSLFATEAVTEIATAAERAGLPEAANALMVGYPGMEEFQTTVALWDLSRGRLTHAAFLESHGYHGAHEGEIASQSWRENSQSIDALAARYRLLKASDDPRQLEVRAIETRQRIQSELRSALPAAERSGLDDALERAAIFLPLREAGRASLTIALDAMRAHARVLARGLVESGALESNSDVFLLTRFELLDLPGNARELVSARRALRENYSGFDLPEAWQGMPQKQTLGSRADGSVNPNSECLSVGTQLNGLGASAGIHEGTARVVLDALELGKEFDPGDVLIAPATDPSWAPFFLIAGAVVIDTGSNISHAAVVAREMGIPAVVSVPDASLTLRTGQRVRVDGNAGSVEVIG